MEAITQPRYVAVCGNFEVTDTDPQRAVQRAISERYAACGGYIDPWSATAVEIRECRERAPRLATPEEAEAIDRRNTNAWATGVISRG